MVKFRATATIALEINAENYEDAAEKAYLEINKITNGHEILNKQVRIEQLKDRRCTVHLGKFSTDEVLPYISKKNVKKSFKVNDTVYNVKINSQRYFVFRENTKCAACGIEGSKFILERNLSDKNPHFNLYSEEDDKLILMTKDHIIPKSCGGEDRHSNFQTMCAICNNLKGASNITLEGINLLRKTYNENKNLPKNQLKDILEEVRENLKECKFQYFEKPKNDVIYINTDISIWETEDGLLMGQPICDPYPKRCRQIACMKRYTEIKPISFIAGNIVIRLQKNKSFYIRQNYVCFGEKDLYDKI